MISADTVPRCVLLGASVEGDMHTSPVPWETGRAIKGISCQARGHGSTQQTSLLISSLCFQFSLAGGDTLE